MKRILMVSMLLLLQPVSAKEQALAPVSGFAHSFVLSKPIADATITILETGKTLHTDEDGRFGPFLYPVGKTITLEFSKSGFTTVQSATLVVPKEGLNKFDNNITFQVPSSASFQLLKVVIGATLDDEYCHVVTTVTARNKLLADCPQGIEGAKLVLIPATKQTPYYFGEFSSGPMQCKTNPFAKNLTETSEDGGAGFMNVVPRDEPYTITAVKAGVKFSEAKFICRKGAFINISPPLGPKEL